MRQSAPFGTWPSPLSAQRVAAAAVRPGTPRPSGAGVYWLETRPIEGGRVVVVRRGHDGAVTDLTPAGFSVRSRVHEYGGGAYAVLADTIYFVNQADQRVYRQGPGLAPVPLTPEARLCYADLVPDPGYGQLLCVREELDAGTEPRAALVAVSLSSSGHDPGRLLAEGADFYAAPRPSPDGTALAWISWDHPAMPWDASHLWTAERTPRGEPSGIRCVAGGPGESVAQPEWGPDGSLYFVSDRHGWWNLYRHRDGRSEPLAPLEAEFALPHWVFGTSTYAVLADGTVACAYTRDGAWHLALLRPGTAPRTVPLPYTVLSDVCPWGQRALLAASSAARETEVVAVDPRDGQLQVLRPATETPDPVWVSCPEPLRFASAGGATAHALFYPPRNPERAGPPDARPPLLVRCHGGPTSASGAALDLVVQYWTTRGFALVDVNYGGSTGYGRAYRERLRGNWGLVDVADCIAAVRYLVEAGRVDPTRVAIRGSSAGGFTALCALADAEVFRAGTVYYGISDLERLAQDTHKFEAHYLDGLIGPWPAASAAYRARSPLHRAGRIRVPVLFFQGLDDPVVPPAQTACMAESLRSRGVPVEVLTFPGESHGFRQAATVERCLEAELAFYTRVLGLADPRETARRPGTADSP